MSFQLCRELLLSEQVGVRTSFEIEIMKFSRKTIVVKIIKEGYWYAMYFGQSKIEMPGTYIPMGSLVLLEDPTRVF